MTRSSTSPTTSDPGGSVPRTLTARSPEDVLAVVPAVLGFWPERSVVMLTFGPQRQFHARVDLPDDAGRDDVRAVAEALVEPARRHRVEKVALVLYTDRRRLAGDTWRELRSALGAHDIGVVDVLRVAEGRWFPLLGGGPVTEERRRTGVPFDVTHHPFVLEALVAGQVLRGSREELAAGLDPDPVAVAHVDALLADSASLPDPLVPPGVPTLLEEGAWAQELTRAGLRGGEPPDDADLARLLASMRWLRVRDAAWSTLTRENARTAVAWWTGVVRRSPDRVLAAPATLLAWSAWQAGRGALAWCALDRCLRVEPDYGLAGLLSHALQHALQPDAWTADFDWSAGLARGDDG